MHCKIESLQAEIAQRDKALKQARSLLMQIDCMNTDCCSRWVSGESNKRDYCQWCVDRSKVLENSDADNQAFKDAVG